MSTLLDPEVTPAERPPWPDRIGYLAAAWAAAAGVLALVWTLTGRGYPFGPNDRNGEASLLRYVPVEVAPPALAAVLLTTAVLALAVAGRHAVRPPRTLRAALLGYGWVVVALLLIVVPDTRVLILLGYAPMLLIGAPFGWPPVDYAQIFDWTLLNKFSAVLGGLLLARTLLTWHFRTADACTTCGRRAGGSGWTSAASAARWGRWAVGIAGVIPVLYAATRLAWVVGIPLGIDRPFLDEMHRTGLVWAGAGLAAFAIAGSVLTLGLVQRWGERFPRWMGGLAGRRVPIMLAVVPATLVAVAVLASSVGLLTAPAFWDMAGAGESLSSVIPMSLFPVWALALGAATLAYYLRRRGGCPRCGRG